MADNVRVSDVSHDDPGERMPEEACRFVDLAVQPAQWIVEYGPKRKFEKSSPGKFFVALNIAQRP
jgi:hypothetical protein